MTNTSLIEDKRNLFIDIVNSINKDLNPNRMVKIKDYAHQTVIETDKYFYKVYEDEIKTGIYKAEIRKKLAEVYSEYGIHWIVKTFTKGNFIYTVEEREKLKVCGNEISANELFYRYKYTLYDLEKKLRFPAILDQVKQDNRFNSLYNMKLIRYCINKTDDYAYGPNGEIILLDDAEFFITFVDKNANQIPIGGLAINCLTTAGELILQNDNEPESNNKEIITFNINKLNKSTHFFFFTKDENVLQDDLPKLVNKVERMIQDNIKVLSDNCNKNEVRLKYGIELNEEIKSILLKNNTNGLYLTSQGDIE